MNGHEVIWSQPAALLGGPARLIPSPRSTVEAPAILRFSNDSFMEEFLALLQTEPERLGRYRVRRETWRGFAPDPVVELPKAPSLALQRLGIVRRLAAAPAPAGAVTESVPAGTPLKLYQPAHQRFYLVACSLVCRVAGLPDRGVEPGRGEQTGCVVRRLLPPAGATRGPVETWDEYAWVPGERGYAWQRVGVEAQRFVPGEERLPLFAVHFAENERRRRRLFAGVIPVGRREAYLGAPKATGSGTPGVTPRTARKILFRKEVVEPWKTLVGRSRDVRDSLLGELINGVRLFLGEDKAPNDTQKRQRLKMEREHIQTISWLILLDFAKYLATYMKPVWRKVLNPSLPVQLTEAEEALVAALESATIPLALRQALCVDELNAGGEPLYALADVATSLREALAKFGSGAEGFDTTLEQQLERVDEPYIRNDSARRALWPDFLFPLADPDEAIDPAPMPPVPSEGTLTAEERGELALDENTTADDLDPFEQLDRLTLRVLRALRDDPQIPPAPAVPAAAVAPENAFEGWFVIRCVFEQPACAPLHGDVVSDPTEPFQMAGFFDPDAPARPIRIGLPIDTTPAGLRKFDKNTAFMISDTLCGQIRRVKGLSLADLVLSVLPWPFHKDLPGSEAGPCKTGDASLGMICSLSIPIVTLCALILVMIMVALFDFIFKWIPYFIFCFPIPGLKAKPEVPRP